MGLDEAFSVMYGVLYSFGDCASFRYDILRDTNRCMGELMRNLQCAMHNAQSTIISTNFLQCPIFHTNVKKFGVLFL